MPDNWSYVVAAYAVSAILLGGYWRYLIRRARRLDTYQRRRRSVAVAGRARPEPGAHPSAQ
jgi:hypothetical protein